MKKNILLLFCLVLPLGIGGLSGYLTSSQINTWYTTLIKPSVSPPNIVFGPVWTTLYTLMGISLYVVLQKADFKKYPLLLGVFSIQLLLNFLWSILFFRSQQIGVAFFEIILLWLSIILMMVVFNKTNKVAALMNLPYLLWVSFASILNYQYYVLNR